MNVAELARRLRISPQELKEKLPELGFDIGMRAIKVDDRTAWRIIENWQNLMRQWHAKHTAAEAAKAPEVVKEKKQVALPAVLTVREFAAMLDLSVARVISELMKNGILVAMNERIDFTTCSIIAQDLGFIVTEIQGGTADETAQGSDVIREQMEKEEAGSLRPRPPVVVVMGHVDHGKTRTLDAIRKTNVMEGEAGGITQHIGAYQVVHRPQGTGSFAGAQDDNSRGRIVTFIDTPGHEAFTTMRSRGARIADVAILVVAADDGVQPQTLEALKIIEAAKLPFVVAVNKMDKPDADADKVKRELSEKGVLPEEWGGKVPFVPISAKTGAGIDALLDVILLLADLEKEKITANPLARAMGTVIESHVDPGEGAVATVLVQNGTLHRNEHLAVGNSLYGRVRAMKDWSGKIVTEALPGTPVKILGFKVAPEVGDVVEAPANAKGLETKKVIPTYKAGGAAPSLKTEEEIAAQTLINVIVKADVLGSLEAILASLEKLQTPEVAVKVVAKGLGNVGEAEVLQAAASGAIIYGFHVAVLPKVADLAREKAVEIQTYKIIYELLDDVKGRLEAHLKPEIIHTTLGMLKVLAVFRKEKSYAIIGGRVEEGKAVKGAKVKVMRAGIEQGEGTVSDLQSAKQSVAEVPGGSECGLKVTTRAEIEVGDVLEIYKEEKKERKLVI